MRVLAVVLGLTLQTAQTLAQVRESDLPESALQYMQELQRQLHQRDDPQELQGQLRQLSYLQELQRRLHQRNAAQESALHGRSLQQQEFTSDLGYVGQQYFQTLSLCRQTEWGVPRQIFANKSSDDNEATMRVPLPTDLAADYPNLNLTKERQEVENLIKKVLGNETVMIGVKGDAGQALFAAEFSWLASETLGLKSDVCMIQTESTLSQEGLCPPGQVLHVLISEIAGPTTGMTRLGALGYTMETGIYLKESTAPVINGSQAPAWYPDWYLSWRQDPTLIDQYPPLEVDPLIRFLALIDNLPECDEAWNLNHPLRSGRKWCNGTGFFVPEQCDNAPCGVVYHSTPAKSTGWIESLIVSYKLPFVVDYVGRVGHVLFTWTLPYPLLVAGEKPGGPDGLKRVQFPIVPPCTVTSGNRDPEEFQTCDVLPPPTWKWVSPTFQENFPAATMLLEKLLLDNDFMDVLLTGEDLVTPELCFDIYWPKIKELRKLVGSCESADQPVPRGGTDCICHEGTRFVANGTDCEPCPPDSYCHLGKEPRSCGSEYLASVKAGRRRRARGPSHPEDCRCLPGAGLTRVTTLGWQACAACPVGTYKDRVGPQPCANNCPPHSSSEVGSISEDNCTCFSGYFRSREAINGRGAKCSACPEEGVDCNGYGIPRSKKGYVVLLDRAIDESVQPPETEPELKLRLFRCPVPTACMANNTCVPGTGGKFCTVCQKGYVRDTSAVVYCKQCLGTMTHLRNYFVWLMVVTAYVNYFGSVIGTSSSKDINIVSMAGKIIFHHGFLTWLVANFPPEIAWTSPVAIWLSRVQYDNRCFFEALGFRSIPQRAVASVLTVIWLPFASLVTSLICCRLTVWYQRKEIAEQQQEVQRANEVISMCEWLEDLHVRDRFRMESIKTEFKGYRWDLITKARVVGIWRTINKDYNHKNTFFMNQWIMLYKFVVDSSGLILAWLIVLHPFVTRDIVSVYLSYTAPDDGTSLVLGTNMEYFGMEHLEYLIPLSLVFIVYCCGLPVFCFYKVKQLHQQQRLLNMEACMRWGYLYYGLELKSPQVFFEVAFIVQRTIMAIIVEEAAFETDGFTSSLREAITLLTLVLFSCSPPFEKVRYHVLDNLMGRAILTCVMTPEVHMEGEVDLTLNSLIQSVKDVIDSNEVGRKNLNVMLHAVTMCAVFAFNMLFWLTIIRELIIEVLYIAFTWVRLVQTGATEAVSSSFIGRRLSQYLPQKWPELVAGVDSSSSLSNMTPVVLLRRFMRLVVAGRERYLAVSMRCKTTDISHGGKGFLSIREIVIHEGTHRAQEPQPERDSAVLAKLRVSTAHASKAAADMAKALSYSSPGIEQFQEVTSRGSSVDAHQQHHHHHHHHHHGQRFNDIERTDLAVALSEAIETLLVIHNLETLPFCVLEFIIADALYCSRMGRQTEINRRQEVFKFVWGHSSGQVRGIEELFEKTPNSPELSYTMRLKELKNTAAKLGTAMHTEKLLVHDIQRYVRQLRFQDCSSVEQWLIAFSDAVQEDVLSRQSGERTENGAQTNFSKDQEVQTDGTVAQSAQTDAIIPTSETHHHRDAPVTQAGDKDPALKPVESSRDERECALREEIETARREAKVLEEEAGKLLQARPLEGMPEARDRQPSPGGRAVGDQPAQSEPPASQPQTAAEAPQSSWRQTQAAEQQQPQPQDSPPAQQQQQPQPTSPAPSQQVQAAPAEAQAAPAQQQAAAQPAKLTARTRKKTNWIPVPR